MNVPNEISNSEDLIEDALDLIVSNSGNLSLASSWVGRCLCWFSSGLLIEFYYLHLRDSKINTVKIMKRIDIEI